MHPAEYRKKYAGKVIGRETVAKYEKYSAQDIEKTIQKQLRGVYTEYAKDSKPKPIILDVDIAKGTLDKGQECKFPKEAFTQKSMEVLAEPFVLFENLNERLLFSNETCLVSTSAKIGTEVNNLSILVYNYDRELYEKQGSPLRNETIVENLKAYDDEAEVLIRFVGMAGDFKIIRYKMTKQNFITAHDEWANGLHIFEKRQTLINSFSSLPSVETGKLSIVDALSLRATLYGFSAELILIDRE
jgi:hypothetical protein